MSAVNGMSQKEYKNNNTVGGRWQNRKNLWGKEPDDHGGGPDDLRK